MNKSTNAMPTAEWIAEVNEKKRGRMRSDTERKVQTNAIDRFKCPSPERIRILLRAGHEIRLTDAEGSDMIRLYPCLDADYRTMNVTAMSMGDFRRKTYEGIAFNLNHCGERVSVEQKREERNARAEKIKEKRAAMNCVTPDTIVECPQCGTAIRVGKQLASEI